MTNNCAIFTIATTELTFLSTIADSSLFFISKSWDTFNMKYYNKLYLLFRLSWWLRWCRNRLPCRRLGFNSWVRKIPWRRAWQPTPIFLPGKFHGKRSLPGYYFKVCWTWLSNWAHISTINSADLSMCTTHTVILLLIHFILRDSCKTLYCADNDICCIIENIPERK